MPRRSFARRVALAASFALVPLAFLPRDVSGQTATIVVSDTVSFRFGFLSQTWADFTQNVRQDTSVAQNIFQRRIRFIMAGQLGPHLTFLFATDNPNLGRGGQNFNKPAGTPFIVNDAVAEIRPGSGSEFMIDAGIQFVPLCRNCVGNAAHILPIDFSSYSALPNSFTGLNAGHDVGILAKGYLNDDRIEYRAGVFSGARERPGQIPTATAAAPLRAAGRIAVQLLDPEPQVYAYSGTYFGRKRVLSVGAGTDNQGDYHAYSADAFLSYPFGKDGMTAAATFIHYDGGTFALFLPRQDTFEAEAGYHFTDAKLTPWVKVEGRRIDEALKTAANQDESRVQVGGTYYITTHWLNLKAAYTRASLAQLGAPSLTQHGATFQVQGFFF